MAVQQQEDIVAVGPLMVRLAGGAASGPALQALAGHLSPHLLHLLASLQNNHISDCHMVDPPAASSFNLSPLLMAPVAVCCLPCTCTSHRQCLGLLYGLWRTCSCKVQLP